MIRPHVPQSLSARLLLLTIGIILLVEFFIFVPGLARERRGWLDRHLREASIVTAGLTADPAAGGGVDSGARDRLLALSDCEMIRVRVGGAVVVTLGPQTPFTADVRIDRARESEPIQLVRALGEFLRVHPRQIYLTGPSPLQPGTQMELLVDETSLLRALHSYAGRVFGLSLLVAAVTGILVYCAVAALLVRPIRRITRSISAFRDDPQRAMPLDTRRVRHAGEIAAAGAELAALQHELREALWRNARLAALGTAMAKVTHDVRNILSTAMLAADRLSLHADPKVTKAAETIVTAVERATDLVRQTLAYAREGPPPLTRAPLGLLALVREAADGIAGLRLVLHIAPALQVDGDRVALLRVLGNMMRNAHEAGAHQVRVAATQENRVLTLELADDGPGLPADVQARLFRPFATGGRGGTGLGLAIARDLTRAHGGDIELVKTGAAGTIFRLTLPAASVPVAEVQQAS